MSRKDLRVALREQATDTALRLLAIFRILTVVPEYSLLCSEIAQRAVKPLIVQLAALLHDAHEAYINDLSSPAKAAVNFRSIKAGGSRTWDRFARDHEVHRTSG